VKVESLNDAFGANAAGIAAMLIACAMFVIGDSCVKLAGQTLALGEIVFLRSLIALPIIVWLANREGVLSKLPLVIQNPRLQLRSLFEVGSALLFLAGIVRMSYADAIAIQQFVPLAVMAGAALIFGQQVGWRRWSAAAVGLVGVMLVVKPGSGTFNWAALLILGCVVCVAGRDLTTRQLGEAIPTTLIALVSILAVGAGGLLLLPFEVWRTPSIWEWGLVAVAGITSLGGFYWSAEAMRRSEVTVVIPFRYSLIPYGVLSGILVFGERPVATTYLGIAVILAAGLYALHRERLRTREARAAAATAYAKAML
jgi:drug/metabolite transporter (DMT)-like permease